jgi:RNA polymerase sigma-32 factor
VWWIHAHLKEYVVKNWSLVKIGTTRNQKKLFFSLRSAKRKILSPGQEELHEDHIQELSQGLNVRPDEIKEMDARLRQDYSLNAPVSSEDALEWQDWLKSDVESHDVTIAHQQELEKRQALLGRSLDSLPARDRQVFVYRRLTDPPKTLEEVAGLMNLSRERVRQIEMQTFSKVQKKMHAHTHALKLH